MLCCAVGVAAVATGAIGWRQLRRFLCERRAAQSLLTASVVASLAIGTVALAAQHFSHPVAHASGIGTALLTDPGVLPLCRGGAPADRITAIAWIEE